MVLFLFHSLWILMVLFLFHPLLWQVKQRHMLFLLIQTTGYSHWILNLPPNHTLLRLTLWNQRYYKSNIMIKKPSKWNVTNFHSSLIMQQPVINYRELVLTTFLFTIGAMLLMGHMLCSHVFEHAQGFIVENLSVGTLKNMKCLQHFVECCKTSIIVLLLIGVTMNTSICLRIRSLFSFSHLARLTALHTFHYHNYKSSLHYAHATVPQRA